MEEALKEIGGFGRYHKRIYFLLCIPILFVGAANLSYVFIAATPKYRCLIPNCDSGTHLLYNTSFLPFTVPTDENGDYKSCQRFFFPNGSTVNNKKAGKFNDPLPALCTPSHFSKITVENCPEGYVFDKSVYESTIVTEFNLTCENGWLAEASQSIFFAGVLVGAFLWGIIADWFGRRFVILLNLVLMALSGVATALSPNLVVFNLTRFIFALSSSGVFQTAFVLGLELVGAEYRELCGMLGQYVFALGEVMLGCIGLYFRKWRMLQLIISAPLTAGILYGFVVPESPRWLLSRGRDAEAREVMEHIARVNHKTLPPSPAPDDDVLQRHTPEGDAESEELLAGSSRSRESRHEPPPADSRVIEVLRTPLLCLRLLSCQVAWIVITFVYYGLSFTATNLAPSSSSSSTRPYVQFMLSALVELPGYTAAWLLMRCWGRRPALALSFVTAALGCAVAAAVYELQATYFMVASLIGKCGITSAFGVIYLYTPEIFPTRSRNTVLGICSTVARLGAMLAPFSDDLKTLYIPLPMIIFAVLSALASTTVMALPETRGAALPDTLDDAMRVGRRVATVPVSMNSDDSDTTPLLQHQQGHQL